ncbi:DnaD domain-containing protein [Cytobacillus horneckiae]|uniref:DnaD domain-containing protein n=1 Tax=Cytobacillus horneckiae TaxID=549687 RepID=UPI003D9A4B70
MAKYRYVQTEFWNDPKIVEEMTPEDKLFFLYLLTNASTTQIGIYQITKKQMAFDIGYSVESINSLLDRFVNHHKIVKYNPDTREIAIKNWGKYNLIRGGKPILDCVKSELKEVKDLSFIDYVEEQIGNDTIKEIYSSFHDTSPDTSTTRGQKEKEKEKENKKENKKEKEHKGESVTPHANDPYVFYESNFGVLTPHLRETLQPWIEDFNNQDEIIVAAMQLALEQNKRNLGYVIGILRNWLSQGVKTLDDCKAIQNQFETRGDNNGYSSKIRRGRAQQSKNQNGTEKVGRM